jgi:hypothetical protein
MRRNPIVHGRLRRPVTPKDAMTIGRRIGEARKWTRDPERFEEFRMGLTEELEHRDVTHGRALSTGRIARAHLKEDPRYYSKLKDMMAQSKGPARVMPVAREVLRGGIRTTREAMKRLHESEQARANPSSESMVGNIVYLRGEKHVEPYKVLEDNGDRVLVRGFVPGWTVQPTRTVRKSEIVRIFRKNPRPKDRVGFIGYYNELGYRICKMSNGRIVDEVYSAGNSPADSQQTVPARHGVGLRKIKEWAEQTGREIADEAESAFFGIEYEKSE